MRKWRRRSRREAERKWRSSLDGHLLLGWLLRRKPRPWVLKLIALLLVLSAIAGLGMLRGLVEAQIVGD